MTPGRCQGIVGHEADGKTYRYEAKVSKTGTTREVIGDFGRQFFDGSTEALLLGLAESPEVSPDVWEKLQSAIGEQQETPDE